MSRGLATVGMVAGVVALAATGVGAAAGAGLLAAKGSTAALSIAATSKSIASYAMLAAVASNVGAQLTAKPPPRQGSTTDVTIGANQPMPYLIGQTYYGGARQHWAGYGQVNKHKNPYLFMADVYSACGPVEGLVARYLDFVPVTMSGNDATGFFANHLHIYHQLGQAIEPALPSKWPGVPNWGPSYGLSSYAAIAWSLRFDADGNVFASGIPQTGAEWRGVKVYDPRKDSTYPGGSGVHRITDEATWEYSECPGLHGLTYAYGRHRAGRKVFGIGIPADGIRIEDFVALANVCDANGWKVGGVIFEPGNRWNNLKDICAAGGAKPGWVGGRLALDISAPRIALDTITEDDLADDSVEIGVVQGWEERLNTLIPKYKSRDHKWEYVQSSPVTVNTFLAEDGEEKADERQHNLVQWGNQSAQLCAYELWDRRELGEIVLRCKPRLRRYGMGDLLIVDLPDDGLEAQPCVVLKRTFDPVTMSVTFILRGETMAKHAFALGQTGTAPPTPSLGGGQENDELAAEIRTPGGAVTITARSAVTLSSTTTTIAIGAFDSTLSTGETLAFPPGTIVGLAAGTAHLVFRRRSDGVYFAEPHPALAAMADSGNILIGSMATENEGGGYPGGDPTPPGWGGGGGVYQPEVPQQN